MCYRAVFKGSWGVAGTGVAGTDTGVMAPGGVYCWLGKFQSESGLLAQGR